MSEMTEEVRETFRTVSADVPVPVFDEVAFRDKVRRARRRRTGNAVLGLGAAAAVASAALIAVPQLAGGGDRVEVAGPDTVPAATAPAVHPDELPEPVYFVADDRLMAATPDGEVQDLGVFAALVGSTAEGALAMDFDGRLVWIGATSSSEGDGSFTFVRGGGPVSLPATGPVQSAALSGDGRWLAWLDADDMVTVWDLKADGLVQSSEVGRNAHVTAVSEHGVLVSLNGQLALLGTSFDVSIPTEGDGPGLVSDLAGGFVTVADRDDVTRVYDVAEQSEDGVAPLADSVPGTGRLAPYARAIVTVDGETVRVFEDGDGVALAGIDGTPQTAGWLDEDHALVTSAEAGGTAIYVCPVAEEVCTRVAFSETDVELGL